LILNLNL